MPAMPCDISVGINPLKRLVVLWLNGFPCPLTPHQAILLEGMLRDARQTVERESADGLADLEAALALVEKWEGTLRAAGSSQATEGDS